MIWILLNPPQATQEAKVKAKVPRKAKAKMKAKTKAKAKTPTSQVTMYGIRTAGGNMTMMEDQMMEIQDGVNPFGLSTIAIQITQVLPLPLGIKANNSNTEIQVIKVSTINGQTKRIRSQGSSPNYSGFYFVQRVKFFEALVAAMIVRSSLGLSAHGMDAKLH